MLASVDALDAHGYDLVRPPLVEFEKSLAGRMASGPNDVSRRRMFRFVDPSSLRTLALRRDMTPQIGRIAATSMAHAPRQLRLHYLGQPPVVRAAPPDTARHKMHMWGRGVWGG